MPLAISITDDSVRFLNEPAKQELVKAVSQYSEVLLSEASRLEAAGNTSTGDPEITSSMVRDADLLLRRGYRKPRKGPLLMTAQIASPILGIGTGILADAEKLEQTNNLLMFIALLVLSVITTVLLVVKE